MIKTINLTKVYGGLKAVDNLNIEVKKGELFGLIGPNGAGKTTAIKMLCCLMSPTSGTALINNLDIHESELEIKRVIGYLPEGTHLYEDMTPKQYLLFFSEIYNIPRKDAEKRISELLDLLRIGEKMDSKIGTLSKGMKKKVAISRALIHNPQILIFDEPTVGLDPITSRFIREFMKNLSGRGKTVLMSTHNLHEAEILCDRVAILDRGKKAAYGSVEELKKKFGVEREDSNLEDIFLKAVENKK
ncbi:MAG: hypothetical protein A7316_00495 [Candidatus Altiarchaeales archaeon WOR_SM1_86-2]|nr:MAG: hypothetical protein A7315_13860 [Candidatus Altiarchaeales archaeon WOR_SM1_79]ODS39115.1 MAG: hypothetical protein A7316_00495 [Candidatus Altiarchaeales archaeon WOR_SM1_86-2]